MKRLVLVMVLVLAVLCSWAYAEQKIKVVTGNIPITLTAPADSTGFLLSPSWQISEMSNGAAEFENFQWDRMQGVFWMSNFTELSTDSAAEGNADTLILRYTFGSGPYTFVFETDTGTIPAVEEFEVSRDGWGYPAKWVGGDSTAVYAYPDYEAYGTRALDQDQFWFVYYATDSAGTGRLSGTLNYYLKFFKDGD